VEKEKKNSRAGRPLRYGCRSKPSYCREKGIKNVLFNSSFLIPEKRYPD
jgi:hypothetical protein